MKHDFTSHDLHLPELTLRDATWCIDYCYFATSNVYPGFEGRFDVLVIHSGCYYFTGNFTVLQGF